MTTVTTPTSMEGSTATSPAGSAKSSGKPLHVVFIHLDLGIGGAEQLVLQLASASQELGHRLDLVTTRCDPTHCFGAVQPGGKLHQNLHVYGTWLPANLGGLATALCSTIRILWLTVVVLLWFRSADVVVLDVLPTSIPLITRWLPKTRVLFYCHFPDKLLLRKTTDTTSRKWYRILLDWLEEQTMACADTLVVNSKFTLQMVQSTFTKLQSKEMSVLYPALDVTNLTESIHQAKTNRSPIVSLNRFERKKNIDLLLHAYAQLVTNQQTKGETSTLPPLIIAGGYDTKNVENVEYRSELGHLADTLQIKPYTTFRQDISDAERATLFQTALCVVYTPNQEHFGIVPLEAMYAETPVVAVNTGGPTETIVDGQTGYLCDPTPIAFGQALQKLVMDPTLATQMGQAGRRHVETNFGPDRLRQEWDQLIRGTQSKRRARSLDHSLWVHVPLYLVEACVAMLVVLVLTYVLRWIGVLHPSQSILGAIRTNMLGEEL